MEIHDFRIVNLKVQHQRTPMGLDVEKPVFSWQLAALTEDRRNLGQSAYQIAVRAQGDCFPSWETDKIISEDSICVPYQGQPLAPCTRYEVKVSVWNEKGACATESTWFETGFLDGAVSAWGGAQWIGAPEKYIRTETMGVFEIHCDFRLEPGSTRAGVVFGGNDPRLLDASKNLYGLAGENYIQYAIDVSGSQPMLEIVRVGYAPGDDRTKPLYRVPIRDYKKYLEQGETAEAEILTKENIYEEHHFCIQVVGGCACAFLDQILIDAQEREGYFGKMTAPRQLNPLGFDNTLTFPRLCSVGYYVGAGSSVAFDGIRIRNVRTPNRTLSELAGVVLEGVDEQGNPMEIRTLENPSAHSLPMFRSEFTVLPDRRLKSARLYITARGIYDCRINGKPITDTWLNPGYSQYTRHQMYQTYDVTEQIQEGENGIGVTLSSGWWCDAQTFEPRNYNYFGDMEAFLLRLELRYEDGSRQAVLSDPETWKYYGEGPYLYAGLFQGEYLDGRRIGEYLDLSKQGYEGKGAKKPVVVTPCAIESYRDNPEREGLCWPAVDYEAVRLVGGMDAPVRNVASIMAKSMTEPQKGVYVYDLGQEMAGVPCIRLNGNAGDRLVLRFGEMLYPDLPAYEGLTGRILRENYRDAESTDCYILRGDPQGETYCPRFTFHGYRYIEVTGLKQPLPLENVTGIQLSSIERITGSIETSDPLLNRFISNVKWSQLCNFISIPTDCPQRNERMGWAGDAHVFCRTAIYQGDVYVFYERYLQAFTDLQQENGQLPEIAPIGGGFGGITYESALIFMAWELYCQYGDSGCIKRYYPAMKRWCEYIREMGMPGDAFVGPLGDWLAVEETDCSLLWNAFYIRDMILMEKMAALLGHEKDQIYFKDQKETAITYWNRSFVEPDTVRTRASDGRICDTQCSYVLPLQYEAFEERYIESARGNLIRKVQEAGNHITTGFFGTGLINVQLSEAGRSDLAYGLMLQTGFPSWLYPVTMGATSVWERWDSYTRDRGFGGNNSMNSFNHYSLGAVVSWLYEYVLGIRAEEGVPAHKRFRLEPAMQVLEYAKGGIDTPYGRIESSWKRQADKFIYDCSIPAGTSARVVLKGDNEEIHSWECTSGKYHFEIFNFSTFR